MKINENNVSILLNFLQDPFGTKKIYKQYYTNNYIRI